MCDCVSVNSSYLIALTTFNKAKAKVASLPPCRIEAPSKEFDSVCVCADVCGIFMLMLIVRSARYAT